MRNIALYSVCTRSHATSLYSSGSNKTARALKSLLTSQQFDFVVFYVRDLFVQFVIVYSNGVLQGTVQMAMQLGFLGCNLNSEATMSIRHLYLLRPKMWMSRHFWNSFKKKMEISQSFMGPRKHFNGPYVAHLHIYYHSISQTPKLNCMQSYGNRVCQYLLKSNANSIHAP